MKKTLEWLIKNRLLVYFVFGGPLVAIGSYQFVHYYITPLKYISWPEIHLFGIPLLEACLLFALFDFYYRFKSIGHLNIWAYVFVFSTTNLIFTFLFAKYYQSYSIQDAISVQVVLQILPYLEVGFFLFTMISFAMGFLFQFEGIYEEYVSDNNTKNAFANSWLGQHTAIVLLFLFVIGLGLRLYHLDGVPPHVDEYAHTEQALSMIHGTPGDYDRSFIVVTVPVYLSFLVFGPSVWAGRLPLVLLNMLAIFPLYLLGRQAHKQLGLIFAALYTSSPWMIASSRTIREYAVLPLLSYFTAVLLLELLNWDGMTLRTYIARYKYYLLMSLTLFSFFVSDNESTLKSALLLYGVVVLVAVVKAARSNLSRHVFIQVVLLACTGLFTISLFQPQLYLRYIKNGILMYSFAPQYWKMIVLSDSHNYWISILSTLILFLIVTLTIYALFRGDSPAAGLILSLSLGFILNLTYLTFFVAHPGLPARTRYGVLAELWYLPLVGIGIWALYQLALRIFKRLPAKLIVTLMLLICINPGSIHAILTYKGGGTAPVTGNPHYRTAPAQEFLASVVTSQDVLVSDILQEYDHVAGGKLKVYAGISFRRFLDSLEQLDHAAVLEVYSRGWVAISPNTKPEQKGFLFDDFIFHGTQMHYIGQFGDIYIWKWDKE